MTGHILGEKEDRWREEARRQLYGLQVLLRRLRAPDQDHETLEGVLRQLEEMFLLAVVGEFNSGKSATINTLLEAAVFEEGAVPATTRIRVPRYGEEGTAREDRPAPRTVDGGAHQPV